MRIWHESLLPKLCGKHLNGTWNEGLIIFDCLLFEKQGWRRHTQTVMYEDNIRALLLHLLAIRKEKLRRGHHPQNIFKAKPERLNRYKSLVKRQTHPILKPWESLDKQIEVLKSKGCKCNV